MTPYITLPPIPAWIIPTVATGFLLIACYVQSLDIPQYNSSDWRRSERLKLLAVAIVGTLIFWIAYGVAWGAWYQAGGVALAEYGKAVGT